MRRLAAGGGESRFALPSWKHIMAPTGTSPVVAGDRRIEWPWSSYTSRFCRCNAKPVPCFPAMDSPGWQALYNAILAISSDMSAVVSEGTKINMLESNFRAGRPPQDAPGSLYHVHRGELAWG